MNNLNDIKKLLKQYPDLIKEQEDLQREITQIQKDLDNMTRKGGYTERDSVSGGNGGKQHYVIEGFPHKIYSERKTKLQMKILKKAQINGILEQIKELIEKEPNVRMRRMMRLKYTDRMTWYQVAMHMGKNCTAESCRKEMERYLKEK